MTVFLLVLLVGCGKWSTESWLKPTERTQNALDESVATECIIRADVNPHICEVDWFEFQDRICVRWHRGYGSDMECWPKDEAQP